MKMSRVRSPICFDTDLYSMFISTSTFMIFNDVPVCLKPKQNEISLE